MRKLLLGLLLAVVTLGIGTAAVSSQTVTPPKVSVPQKLAAAGTEVLLTQPSPKMETRIALVIAYCGSDPLPINGPDEGFFDLVTIKMWVRDFPDKVGREAYRVVVIEFIDTGRVVVALDWNNRWRSQAVEALNPIGG